MEIKLKDENEKNRPIFFAINALIKIINYGNIITILQKNRGKTWGYYI